MFIRISILFISFILNFVESSSLFNIFLRNNYEVGSIKSNLTDTDSMIVFLKQMLNVTNLPKTTNFSSHEENKHDPMGALIYMIVIMLIFAALVILILVAKVKPRKLNLTDAADREKAEYLLRNMQEHVVTEKILEQLRNREFRSKAWEIYRSQHQGRRNSKLDRTLEIKEQSIIKNIDQKLENIQKSKKALDEKTFDELNLSFRSSSLKSKIDKEKLDKNKIGLHKNLRRLSPDKPMGLKKIQNNDLKSLKSRQTRERKQSEESNKNNFYYTISSTSLERIPISSIKNMIQQINETPTSSSNVHKMQKQHEKLNSYVKNSPTKGRFTISPAVNNKTDSDRVKSVSFNSRNNVNINDNSVHLGF